MFDSRALVVRAKWSFARVKTFGECVRALLDTLVAIDEMQSSRGVWRMMREGPTAFGPEVELTREHVTLLLEGKLPGSIKHDERERHILGYGFALEYVGPVPIIFRGNLGRTIENFRIRNGVNLEFWDGTGVPEYDLDLETVEELFGLIVRIWQPQEAQCNDNSMRDASPRRPGQFFPPVGWLNYFGEPAVVDLLKDVGEPFHHGVLIKAAERVEDVGDTEIHRVVDLLEERGVENVLYREL